jgi:hypothetical protein
VTLTAAPTGNSRFDGWSGDVTSGESQIVVTVNADMNVTATFIQQYSLTVTLAGTGSGTVTKVPDQAWYDAGTQVTLTAAEDTGSRFDGWSGDVVSTQNQIVVTMDANKAVTATFIQQYSLTVTLAGSGSGTVTKVPDQAWYDPGTEVTLTATPTGNSRFDGWTGDVTSGESQIVVTVNADMNVTATFIARYSLTVTLAGSGTGTVTKDPDQALYDAGTQVTLTAAPTGNSRFDGWSGDVTSGESQIVVTMNADMNVTATFIQQYVLTVNIVGSGQVTLNPPGGTYDVNTPVTLTAEPAGGWRFGSWSGDVTGTQNPATVTMSANKTVTATFIRQYILTVYFAGDGSGTVTLTPPGSTYDDDTQVAYDVGTQVTLLATPAAGSQFNGWSGAVSGTQNPVTVTMNGDRTVFVQFTRIPYTLTISKDGDGSGTWTKEPNKTIYYYGEEVTLTATPATGSQFDGWSGDVTSTDNPVVVTMDGNKVVTVTFSRIPYTLTVDIVGCGTVNRNPSLDFYYYGDQVTLTAVPCTGWRFAGWSGDLPGTTNPATLTMNGNKSVIAIFTEIPYTLTVNTDGCGTVTKDPDKPTYIYNDVVMLTAVPCPGWSFAYWSGDRTGTQNPATLTMNGNKVVTAHFIQDEYTLTVNVVGSGSVTKDPDKPTYHYGDAVTLRALPAVGWKFDHWEGALSGDDNPVTLTIYGNTTVRAIFIREQYTLTVAVVGNGTVIKDPDKGLYDYGEAVELDARPATGWRFGSWSGDYTGTQNPVTIYMTRDKTVTATFIRQYILTVIFAGDGSGTVTLTPPGGTYDAGTQVTYDVGTDVTLLAAPDPGSQFNGWSGAVTGTQNPATVEMTANKTVTVYFIQLRVLTVDTGGCSDCVLFEPPGGEYADGTVVTLTPMADPPGFRFEGWSGPDADDLHPNGDGTWWITMDGDKSIQAIFISRVYLPFIGRVYALVPGQPTLYPISNPDGLNRYTVSWTVPARAETYVLEESIIADDFSGASEVYVGPLTSYEVTRGAARYYYRVKARKIPWGDGKWSNTQSVDVFWELEPNDDRTQANGPLVSGAIYHGTFPDPAKSQDYFYFEMPAAHSVEIRLTNIAGGQDYDLYLYNENGIQVGYSNLNGVADEYIFKPNLAAGKYYIMVYHNEGGGSTQPYNLWVIYQ